MSRAATERDVWLAGSAMLAAAAALGWAVLVPAEPIAESTTPVVALVKLASADLRVRPSSTLGWRTLARGEHVHDADAVFVPPGGEAQLEFSDGTVLVLDEHSLVVVEPPRGGARTVTLRQGSMSGTAGPAGLTVDTAAGSATLASGAVARVELNADQIELQVTRGEARLGAGAQAAAVSAGNRARGAGAQVEALPAFPLTPVAPAANWRQLYRPGAAVELGWQGAVPPGARLQVARDRLFAFVSRELDASAGKVELPSSSPGVTWWRLVSARGEPISESRRFTLVEDVAPSLIAPQEGEVVNAPAGTAVAFAWTPLPGVSHYRLELSGSRGFEPVQLAQEFTGSTGRLRLDLAEGSWYWRVRASDDDLGEGQPSAPARFRLIVKAIPAAPELLNPEIEVSPE